MGKSINFYQKINVSLPNALPRKVSIYRLLGGYKKYAKNLIHLPRQHLPFPNVRIRIKRHGGTAWLDRTI